MPTYDYTKDDIPPESAEDFTIADVTASAKSADQLEAENGFQEVPPGDHLLIVKGFVGPPQPDCQKVFVNGRLVSYNTHVIKVIFMLPDQPRATVRDSFRLPPASPGDLHAYYEGKSKPEDKSPRFDAAKFLHFISRLGWPYPPGGKLPEEARALRNWKGRAIHATVVPGRPWVGNDGKERQGFNSIKLFSYRPSQETLAGGEPHADAEPGPPRRTAGVSQVATVGLNDL